MNLSVRFLARELAAAALFTTQNLSRKNLSNVEVLVRKDGSVIFTATDGVRLARVRSSLLPDSSFDATARFYIPLELLKEFGPVRFDRKQEFLLVRSGDTVTLTKGNLSAKLPLITTFVNYERIVALPIEEAHLVTLNPRYLAEYDKVARLLGLINKGLQVRLTRPFNKLDKYYPPMVAYFPGYSHFYSLIMPVHTEDTVNFNWIKDEAT